MNIRLLWFSCLTLIVPAAAYSGPFPPAATNPLTTACSATSGVFIAWATGATNYLPGIDEDSNDEYIFDPGAQNPALALGKPGCSSISPYHIISLGGGGSLTLTFDIPIADGGGWDFAVFENSFNDFFLELAYVEVSSDGAHFVRFPSRSLTDHAVPTYAVKSNGVDASNIDGLASKYRAGYGTPFDLSDLNDDPRLDKQNVRFVRLIDIIGDGRCLDSSSHPIYDPYPTYGTPGLDLDAIGIINTRLDLLCRLDESGATLSFTARSNRTYTVQWTSDLSAQNWTDLTPPFTGNNLTNVLTDTSAGSSSLRFYRLRETYLQ